MLGVSGAGQAAAARQRRSPKNSPDLVGPRDHHALGPRNQRSRSGGIPHYDVFNKVEWTLIELDLNMSK